MHHLEMASSILDCLNEIIYVSDPDNKLLYVNKAGEQFTGRPAKEALHKKCYQVFQSSSGSCTSMCPVYKKHNIQPNCQFEKIMTANSGQKCNMQVSAYPLYENGRIAGTIMVMQDITRLREFESLSIKTRRRLEEELLLREKLEESLHRSEAVYRAMFEHTGTAMLVIDEDKTIAMANREVENITGYRIEDIVGKRKWDEFVHPDDIKWMMKYHIERRKEGAKVPNHYEFRLIDANGNIKDIYYSIGMIPGTGQSIGSMIDISERKQMERVLRESEDKYRQLLENIEDVFYEVDLFGNFTLVNDAVNHVFGVPREQLIGCNFRELTDDENAQKIYQAYNKVLNTGVPERGFSWVVYSPKGVKKYLEVSASPIRDSNGNITGFRGMARDITERIRFEQRLRFLSMHDALTGLYNRTYFEEEMQRLSKSRHFPVSIICDDVDGLKAVNDTMGHKKGDELLQATAKTLKSSIRAGDVTARVGGDEFVIILPGTGNETVERIVKRVRMNIEEYNELNPDLPLSISLGWATAESAGEISGLYKRADDNMYREKMFNKKYKETVSSL